MICAIEETRLHINDLMPGMRNVNMRLEVLEVSDPHQIITGQGIEHDILELEVGDETGKIKLVLWDDRIIHVKIGDAVRIENGFVSSFKGEWKINVGKSGKAGKI